MNFDLKETQSYKDAFASAKASAINDGLLVEPYITAYADAYATCIAKGALPQYAQDYANAYVTGYGYAIADAAVHDEHFPNNKRLPATC